MKFADHYKMENYTSAYFKASTMDDDEIHTLTISEARLSNFKSGDVKITLDFVEDRRTRTKWLHWPARSEKTLTTVSEGRSG
jgi:uncharacterized beta-barrel protein YwiB (DUF1934 family)